ncbi:MAG: FxsA family protein, partial [Pseudomonadota bacterium]|nr:FxsA family protein [Pseudomonadota bacterium]
MPVLLLILFIAVPIAEIAIFIQAGERFGLWPALGLVILTAILG